jgi:DNA-binding NtrC family response regulator
VHEHLESQVAQMHRSGILYQEAVCEFKKTFISAALRDNEGNISKTAPALGLHRNTLARICFELQLDIRGFRPTIPNLPPNRLGLVLLRRRGLLLLRP